jgi:hypothetical protein
MRGVRQKIVEPTVGNLHHEPADKLQNNQIYHHTTNQLLPHHNSPSSIGSITGGW